MRGYCLINQTSDPSITRDLTIAMAATLAKQQVELCEWWQRTTILVAQADTLDAAPSDLIPARMIDVLDDPNALAYHTVDALGRPYILMGWGVIKQNGGTLTGTESMLTATSHEFCETTVDPYCSFFWDVDSHYEIPIEACDSVQGDSYEVDPGSGLYVSNFLGPRYFSSGAGPYDRMGRISRPGAMSPGGYQSRRSGGPSGQTSDVFAMRPHEGGMPDWKRLAKACAGSRRSKRHGIHLP